MEQNNRSQKRFDRRTFIGTSMAATLALAVAAKSTSAQTETAPIGTDSKGRPLPHNPRTFQAMPTRNLGQISHPASLQIGSLVRRMRYSVAIDRFIVPS